MTLLDTNVVVHYLKGDPEIVVRINNASRGALAIPTIVVYELEYGTLQIEIPSPAPA